MNKDSVTTVSGSRKRRVVDYADSLSERAFLKAAEDGTLGDLLAPGAGSPAPAASVAEARAAADRARIAARAGVYACACVRACVCSFAHIYIYI